MKRATLLFVTILFLSLSAKSQLHYKVTVIDPYGKLVENPVLILETGGEIGDILIADSTSTFIFSMDNIRDYILQFSAPGFQERTIEGVNVYETRFDVVLDPLMELEIDEVTVEYKKPTLKLEGGKFVLDNISYSPFAKGQMALDLMRFMPLIRVNSDNKVSILGKSEAEIYINGRKSNLDEKSLESYLKTLPAEEIERIEINPSSGVENDASGEGGIINIVLKKKPEEGYSLYLTGMSYSGKTMQMGYGSVYLDTFTKKINLTAGVTGYLNYYNMREEEYKELFNTNSILDSYYDSEGMSKSTSANLNLDYNITGKQVLGFRINGYVPDNWSRSKQSVDYRTGAVLDSIQTGYFRSSNKKVPLNIGSNVNYNLKTDDRGSLLKMDVNYSVYNGESKSTGDYETRIGNAVSRYGYLQFPANKMHAGVAKIDHSQVINDNSVIAAGFSQSFSNIDSDLTAYDIRENFPDELTYLDSYRYRERTTGVYAKYSYNFSEKFQAEIGLRYQYSTSKGSQRTNDQTLRRSYSNFFPSFSLSWQVSEDHSLSFDFASRIYKPNFTEYNSFVARKYLNTVTVGNPDLNPLKIYTTSLYYTLFTNYVFSVSYNFFKDGFATFSLPAEGNIFNKKSLNYGNRHIVYMSADASKSLFKGLLNLNGSLDLTYERFAIMNPDIPLKNLNRWMFGYDLNSMIFFSQAKKISFSVNLSGDTGFSFIETTLPAQTYLAAFFDFHFGSGSLKVGAYNLTSWKHRYTQLTTEHFARGYSKRSPLFYVSYYHRFGNEKIKRVQSRSSEEIDSRLQSGK